jgi:NAD(P)H dehydrogenase (quinone)
MANVLIVYATDWGSTKKMAEAVAAGVASVTGSQATMKTAEETTAEDVAALPSRKRPSLLHSGYLWPPI